MSPYRRSSAPLNNIDRDRLAPSGWGPLAGRYAYGEARPTRRPRAVAVPLKASPVVPLQWLMLIALLIACCATLARAQGPGIESLRETGKAFASVAREVSPAVVFVQVEKEIAVGNTRLPLPFGGEGSPFGDDFFERFFGQQRQQAPQEQPELKRRVTGQGSGFVISRKGYILTNNHVVADADKVTVKTNDGGEYSAKVIGTDPQSDVAVIQVEDADLPVVRLGDSGALDVGEWVVAIGNPFGLQHTLTVGVVSAKGRTSLGINDYEDFIQTDAAINPGNSGGPLVNLSGEAIGMNTAIFSRSGGYMGIGFAIPINLAKSISDQLIENGTVTRGYLGIVIQPLTRDLAKSFGLKDDTRGILVAQVAEDSPAAEAGFKQGDVIVAYNGQPVTKIGAFRNSVAMTSPGTDSTVTVLRDGDREKLHVTIGKLASSEAGETARGGQHESNAAELGFTVQTLNEELAKQFGIEGTKGVVVTQLTPGSAAAEAGLKVGSVILEVDRKHVASASEFKQALAASKKDNQVLLLVQQGEHARFVVLKWE